MSLLEEAYEPPLASSSVDAGPPIQTFLQRRAIAGKEVELVVQTYDDRILVIATQNGKIGCMTQASLPPTHVLLPPSTTALSPLPPPPSILSLTPLLGSPPSPTLHMLYVSQIATLILWSLQLASAPRRPVIVGLSLGKGSDDELDEAERERFDGVMKLVSSWPGPP